MDIVIIILAAITFLSTLFGGLIILRFRNSLPFFFAFAAGSLMGVAFLDILPESLSIASGAGVSVRYIMLAIVGSFFFYHLVERFFVSHDLSHHDGHGHIMGPVGAGSLIIHSLLDGAAIGAAFHVNSSVGMIVALAVIFHDFTDGVNTVTIMLKNHQKKSKAIAFLVLDALAPVVGVSTMMFIAFPAGLLAIVLAVFVGEFIYIGASNLLPATAQYPSKKMLLSMGAGIGLIAILTAFI